MTQPATSRYPGRVSKVEPHRCREPGCPYLIRSGDYCREHTGRHAGLNEAEQRLEAQRGQSR